MEISHNIVLNVKCLYVFCQGENQQQNEITTQMQQSKSSSSQQQGPTQALNKDYGSTLVPQNKTPTEKWISATSDHVTDATRTGSENEELLSGAGASSTPDPLERYREQIREGFAIVVVRENNKEREGTAIPNVSDMRNAHSVEQNTLCKNPSDNWHQMPEEQKQQLDKDGRLEERNTTLTPETHAKPKDGERNTQVS